MDSSQRYGTAHHCGDGNTWKVYTSGPQHRLCAISGAPDGGGGRKLSPGVTPSTLGDEMLQIFPDLGPDAVHQLRGRNFPEVSTRFSSSIPRFQLYSRRNSGVSSTWPPPGPAILEDDPSHQRRPQGPQCPVGPNRCRQLGRLRSARGRPPHLGDFPAATFTNSYASRLGPRESSCCISGAPT